jgi:glycerophosphoryl diester phosphodiesterase
MAAGSNRPSPPFKMNTTPYRSTSGGLAAEIVRSERPLVIAHRGYSSIAPENSRDSFLFALATGADLVELDYYHSREGELVVFHDATLDRTTDARALWGETGRSVSDKTWEELQQLDNGAWFRSRYAGSRLLGLAEAIDLIQGGSVTLIERKKGDPETLIGMLRRKNLLEGVVVQSFDWEFIRGCRSLESRLILGALGPPAFRDGARLAPEARALDSRFLDEIEAAGAQIVGWNGQVSGAGVAEAHQRGLRVWVYVVNELDRARELMSLGVDGLISDNPGLMWKALALKRGSGADGPPASEARS